MNILIPGFGLCLLAFNVSAAPVILDTTTINFSASGSPNTIVGPWSASPLVVSDGATIDYFTVEITDLVSDYGDPSSINFTQYITGNSRSLAFCGNTSSCVTDAVVGNIGIINSGSTVLWAWDFMNRLIEGNDYQTNSGNSTVAYSSGGGTASITGSVLVNLYGEPAVVPIPSAVWLFGSGLIGLVGLARRKQQSLGA